MSDLPKRLRIKAGMIEMCERIAFGSDAALMREAANVIERLEQVTHVSIPTRTMEYEFSNYHRRGFSAGMKRGEEEREILRKQLAEARADHDDALPDGWHDQLEQVLCDLKTSPYPAIALACARIEGLLEAARSAPAAQGCERPNCGCADAYCKAWDDDQPAAPAQGGE